MTYEDQSHRDALNRNLMERVAVGDMLRRLSRECGEKDAIVEIHNGQRRCISYQQLNAQANQLVRGLREQGLKQGNRIALLSTNSIDFFIVTFACYKAGMVLVPINFLQSADDIHYNFEHAEVSAVIYESPFEPLALQCAQGINTVRLTVAIGDDPLQGNHSLNQLMTGYDDRDIDDIIINDRDAAQLIYTSGTTSRPKGVETSHLAIYFASLSNPLSFDFGRYHAHLVVLPVFHCAALMFSLATFQTGGPLILLKSFDPKQVLDAIEDENVMSCCLLPMMWKGLLQMPDIASRQFEQFRMGFYAMAPMDNETLSALRQTFNSPFHLASGQTEFTPAACLHFDSAPTEFAGGNYWGIPTAATDQAVLDEHGNELPPGEKGEICWRGPQVMNGYYKNPEATAEVSQFGWHHSGDMGMIDSEGQLLFIDRKKDIIKSGGENVSSCQVEKVLIGIAGVTQAAAFGVPHPHWGEVVCAAIQTNDETLDEAQVIEHCKVNLSGYQAPKRVIFIESFPLTGTGKVRKNILRDQYKDLYSGM